MIRSAQRIGLIFFNSINSGQIQIIKFMFWPIKNTRTTGKQGRDVIGHLRSSVYRPTLLLIVNIRHRRAPVVDVLFVLFFVGFFNYTSEEKIYILVKILLTALTSL